MPKLNKKGAVHLFSKLGIKWTGKMGLGDASYAGCFPYIFSIIYPLVLNELVLTKTLFGWI